MHFFMERILPHINIALSAALLIVAVLHLFNPMMGFLNGKAAFVLIPNSLQSLSNCSLMSESSRTDIAVVDMAYGSLFPQI